MALRRKVGIQGIQRDESAKSSYKKVGSDIALLEMTMVNESLAQFRENLEAFAKKYKNDINKNPEFRKQFQVMCNAIGVDPLASKKGFWAQMLGFGDFYYELGVQIVEVCLRTRARNGGLIEIGELRRHLQKMRGRNFQEISEDDVERAIKNLKCLGSGFNLVHAGSCRLVQSVPLELSTDHTAIITLAQQTRCVSASQIRKELEWSESRTLSALQVLLQEGMVWLDDQGPEWLYYFPSMFADQFE